MDIVKSISEVFLLTNLDPFLDYRKPANKLSYTQLLGFHGFYGGHEKKCRIYNRE
jgi:hypothetical protein